MGTVSRLKRREREREKFSIEGSGFLFSFRRICKLEARWWVGSWRVVKTEMPERRKDRISSALLEMQKDLYRNCRVGAL